MRTVISQSIVLPAPAESLFVMYTDPAKHAAITGAPVAISLEPGSPFQAFNGALTGATLQIIAQRLVIQSWRSTRFNDADPDSTLILAFTPEETNGRIDLVHLDVPAHNYLECPSRIPASCAREETRESRGMACLFLNTERVFGRKTTQKSGFRRHHAGSKMPTETFFMAISRWRVVSRRALDASGFWQG